jgi:hypothetical protein
VRFAFLGFSGIQRSFFAGARSPGTAPLAEEKMLPAARERADIVVVSLHWRWTITPARIKDAHPRAPDDVVREITRWHHRVFARELSLRALGAGVAGISHPRGGRHEKGIAHATVTPRLDTISPGNVFIAERLGTTAHLAGLSLSLEAVVHRDGTITAVQ